ncbi:hypothetical protein SAY87_015197 [Trapa incisa]|uniref:Phytocyanin domain-containing protein n=1 Tax=Trapa incisa TaxID=236973 RepID=A0AAN7JDW7_9MYRT|nr:hypothetical protein SAY87_015197 [Trapa incisa]
MASSNCQLTARLLVLGCALTMMVGSASASTTHKVGDSYGWETPLQVKFFEDWAKSKTFHVGDVLSFEYRPTASNVVVVDKAGFDGCTSNATPEAENNGATTYTLAKAGDYYFINTHGKHCEYGQKLHVSVA